MLQKNRKVLIVLAITPGRDSVLIQEALGDSELEHQLLHIHNGLDLMDYLNHDGRWSLNDRLPDLLILDLDMPVKSGMEVLREIKQAPRLRRIAVIVLAGSNDRSVLAECYRLGVSAAVIRGSRLLEFTELIRASGKFWFRFVTAPLSSYEGDDDVNPESRSREVGNAGYHRPERFCREHLRSRGVESSDRDSRLSSMIIPPAA
ncbi:MAG: response regulator [Syntrophobacteraceae bacterium]